jgi:SAM-dependent methyltransferase
VGTAIGLLIALAAAWYAIHSRAPATLTKKREIISFATVKPVLDALPNQYPAELHEPNESKWKSWAQREDALIRARLEQGARDSMINLVLFGTSFTDQPRAQALLEPNDPLFQSRLNDFLRALRDPHGNERLIFVRNLLERRGVRMNSSSGDQQAKAFILENRQRVRQEQIAFERRFDEATRESDGRTEPSESSGVFRDRGISLDTTVLSSFSIDAALGDMKSRGALHENSITRVAVIGPGLDFTDKRFGYDFYPLQILQPFAVYDSLVRLGLAQDGKIDIVGFDISPEVLDHLRRARERAGGGEKYVVQLPRESRPWVPKAIEYWRSFGNTIGEPVTPIQPPAALKDLETRAVRIRPQVVMSCQAADWNFVLEQLNPQSKEQFDLVIATNVLVYYDTFEQALAVQNISTMLKPGAFLLTNTWLPRLPQIPMHVLGYMPVRYGEGAEEGENIFWWQRQ